MFSLFLFVGALQTMVPLGSYQDLNQCYYAASHVALTTTEELRAVCVSPTNTVYPAVRSNVDSAYLVRLPLDYTGAFYGGDETRTGFSPVPPPPWNFFVFKTNVCN